MFEFSAVNVTNKLTGLVSVPLNAPVVELKLNPVSCEMFEGCMLYVAAPPLFGGCIVYCLPTVRCVSVSGGMDRCGAFDTAPAETGCSSGVAGVDEDDLCEPSTTRIVPMIVNNAPEMKHTIAIVMCISTLSRHANTNVEKKCTG